MTMALYALTIFLSSFLLFLVQPLIARQILPWFGGSAAVWTTCMLFFQAMLLAGYAYAHYGTARLAPRRQALLHIALLALALATLPIAPSQFWKPAGGEEPITRILLLLIFTVGLPYFLLASTSPLVQAWFARARPERDPYRLFAVSNLASLIALVGYPFVVEPWLAGGEQVRGWSWGFALFALLCAALAWFAVRRGAPRAETQPVARVDEAATPAPTRGDYALWLALSATGSILLLAVTNHLTQNVAAVPLLWLAPLTLYLLTFILAFDGRGIYRPRVFWLPALAALGAMAWLLADSRFHFKLALQLGVFLPGLFFACMFCHGELYRLRPAARHLTVFYLVIAAGGALGGLFVAVFAPLAFDAYYELGVGLVALGLLVALRYASMHIAVRLASFAALVAAAGCAAYDSMHYHDDVLRSSRSFFGVLRVKQYGTPGEDTEVRRLLHGAIMHGEQYMNGERRTVATTYYHDTSGIGAAIRAKNDALLRVGVIGLGTGTLATYGRAGDRFRFYDINPDVVRIARSDFAYLSDCKAKVDIVLGDARLAPARAAPQDFDVLAVDAFSGDAIPVHLVTREALAVYLRQVKPDGIVAFHVSNRFLRLEPVVAGLARALGAHAVAVHDFPPDGEQDDGLYVQSDWVLVSRDAKALAQRVIRHAGAVPVQEEPRWRTWTDDYSNLVQILK
jgi:spermidine synthase/MFS family permease